MKGFDSSYQFGFSVALAVHLTLAAVLMLDKSIPHQGGNNATNPTQIVEAVTIDAKEVDAAVAAIQKHQNDHQQHAAEEIRQAAIQKQREVEHLEQIRKQVQSEMQKQQAIEKENNQVATKLKELKAQQADMALKQLQAKQHLESAKKASEAAALAKRVASIAQAKAEEQKHAAMQQEQENAELERSRVQQTAQLAGVVNKYAALIKQAIAHHWILPVEVNREASCKVQIRLAATGQVLSVTLIRSSGNQLLDRSVTAAVYKASPLPVPSDSAAFAKMRVINLTLRPEQVLSG